MRLLCLALLICLAPIACKREEPAPATRPTTQASTAPATRRGPTTSYVDLVRARYPSLPATQPLGMPVDMDYAGHWILPDPIYIDARGDLWITNDEALPTDEVLKAAPNEQLHVIRERVAYVQWAMNEENKPIARLAVLRDDGNYEWIDGDQRRPMTSGRRYRWNVTIPLSDRLVVPTDRGVAMFMFAPQYSEAYQEVVSPSERDVNEPAVLLDPRGILAWSPWDGNKPGGSKVYRFVDEKWHDLVAEAQWPSKVVYLIPLLDGSVLQLVRGDDGKVAVALSPLEAPSVNEKEIASLVDQLSEDEQEKRDAAFAQLTRYGPASWPVLEKLRENQTPEARTRIDQLLRDRIVPTLGGNTLVDGNMRCVDHFDDGGVLFFAPAGVSIPPDDSGKKPVIVKPAWLSIRPGRAVELLEPVLVKESTPEKQHVFAFGDEWIISDAVQGPRRLLGNHLEVMLHKEEAAFANVVGPDRRGRWLFRQAKSNAMTRTTPPLQPSSQPSSQPVSQPANQEAELTLIVDPTLPDPSPKLPVWLIFVDHGAVGWTPQDWPAIKRGGAWALKDRGWEPLDEAKEKFIASGPAPAQLPPGPQPPLRRGAGPFVAQPGAVRMATRPATTMAATTRATTGPTTVASIPSAPKIAATAPATTMASTAPATTTASTQEALGPPILIDPEGRKYFGGKRSLRIIDRDGKEIVWTLPGTAASNSNFPVVLIRTPDGMLFLFNAAGRVIRIKPTPDGPEPFVVEAVFTHKIPNSDIRRIWLDPAGRIIIAYEGNRLAILFPSGRIPPHIATLILEQDR